MNNPFKAYEALREACIADAYRYLVSLPLLPQAHSKDREILAKSAVHSAPAFKFTRGPQVYCQGDW